MEAVEFIPINYPSDLTDGQWEAIADYFPHEPNSEHHRRSLVNAVLYLLDNDSKRRAIPHEYQYGQSYIAFTTEPERVGYGKKSKLK